MLKWLAQSKVDVLTLQEIKTGDVGFCKADIEKAGYHLVFCGQKTYNGVAIMASTAPQDVVCHPSFPNSGEEKRVIAATVGGVRIINVYVVNGSEVGSEKYRYKLKWLKGLTGFIKEELQNHPRCVVLGDFNIAPNDSDVHDPVKWRGHLLCSEEERAAFNDLLDIGLIDTYRLFQHAPEDTFSWWDYRGGSFNKNNGLRIDLILSSTALAEHCIESGIDRKPRGWDTPSDHTPVTATFAMS